MPALIATPLLLAACASQPERYASSVSDDAHAQADRALDEAVETIMQESDEAEGVIVALSNDSDSVIKIEHLDGGIQMLARGGTAMFTVDHGTPLPSRAELRTLDASTRVMIGTSTVSLMHRDDAPARASVRTMSKDELKRTIRRAI